MNKLFIEINKTEYPIETNNNVLNCFIKNKTVNQVYVNYSDEKIVVTQEFFLQKLKVSNICRYIITKENENYILIPFASKDPLFIESNFNDQKSNYKDEISETIVLILESPHIAEYTPNFEPIAPAQKATGINIKTFLPTILNNNKIKLNLLKTEYRLIILNPIPFQTSLNFLHKQPIRYKNNPDATFIELRDNVWSTLWANDKNFAVLFKENLHQLKPDVILNCCTKEASKIISTTLKDVGCNIIYKTCHPSYWDSINGKIEIYKVS